MQSAYIPVLIYAALVVAFPAVTLILAKFIRPASTSVGAKLKPYECGIPPESDARPVFGAVLHRGHVVRNFRRGDHVPHSVGDSVQRVGRTSSGAIRLGLDGTVPWNPA